MRVFDEIGDDVFSILVDESRDVSKKEQMAVVLRFVDKRGVVKERFVGLVHVKEKTSQCLKSAIDELFDRHKLSFSRVRGQGYEGASNMSGEFNGLKAQILKENSSAYFVHCFAHQLQLVVVTLANKHDEIYGFFDRVSTLTNVVCASCKRMDMIRDRQRERLEEQIGDEEIETGKGKNQEISLARAGDTRWSSHHKTLIRLHELYPTIIDVLKYIEKPGFVNASQKTSVRSSNLHESFDFVYFLHLMKKILGITSILSDALQRKDQDILNAVKMIRATNQALQKYRLEEDVTTFCEKYDIEVINLEEDYIDPKNRRRKTNITNRHFYEFDNFNTVLDMQIQELNNQFSEMTTELLDCMSSLSPTKNFGDFNIQNLLKLAEMYPLDFNYEDKAKLEHELGIYISCVKEDPSFLELTTIATLTKKLVEERMHLDFSLVYRLLKLSLVLTVATASVERCFSAMKHVKTDLRNRMGDDYLNDSCICYIERELFQSVSVEDVMLRFQNMKSRREQL